jgi:hypothetical protein
MKKGVKHLVICARCHQKAFGYRKLPLKDTSGNYLYGYVHDWIKVKGAWKPDMNTVCISNIPPKKLLPEKIDEDNISIGVINGNKNI